MLEEIRDEEKKEISEIIIKYLINLDDLQKVSSCILCEENEKRIEQLEREEHDIYKCIYMRLAALHMVYGDETYNAENKIIFIDELTETTKRNTKLFFFFPKSKLNTINTFIYNLVFQL